MNESMRRNSFASIFFVTAISLIAQYSTAADLASQSTSIEGVWKFIGDFSGDEGPDEMLMTFQPDGRLEFSGGFEYDNPATWSYDPIESILSIGLNHMESYDVIDFRKRLNDGELLGFSEENKELTYRVSPEKPSLVFRGWYFEKEIESE